ncbi:hypothetical protein Hanom_Chr04g00313351 [Helianthus anomalus]
MIAAMLPVAPRVPAEFRRVRSAMHVSLWCTSANTEVSIVWYEYSLMHHSMVMI